MSELTLSSFRNFAAAPNSPFCDAVYATMPPDAYPRLVSACEKLLQKDAAICFGPWSKTKEFYQVERIDLSNHKMDVLYANNTTFAWHPSHILNMIFLSLTESGSFEAFTFAPIGGELVMKAVEFDEPRNFEKWIVRCMVPVPSAIGYAASLFAESNIAINVDGAPSPPPSPSGEVDGSDDSDEAPPPSPGGEGDQAAAAAEAAAVVEAEVVDAEDPHAVVAWAAADAEQTEGRGLAPPFLADNDIGAENDSEEAEEAAKPPLKRKFAACDESSRTPAAASAGAYHSDSDDSTIIDTPPPSPSPKRHCAEGDGSCSYIN